MSKFALTTDDIGYPAVATDTVTGPDGEKRLRAQVLRPHGDGWTIDPSESVSVRLIGSERLALAMLRVLLLDRFSVDLQLEPEVFN